MIRLEDDEELLNPEDAQKALETKKIIKGINERLDNIFKELENLKKVEYAITPLSIQLDFYLKVVKKMPQELKQKLFDEVLKEQDCSMKS